MTRTRFVILSLCLLCVATQGGCKGLKALAGIVKAVSSSGIDDFLRAGRGVIGAAKVGDDAAKQLGIKAAKGAGKWGFKQLREAMSAAETNTNHAQAVLMRAGPHAGSRAMDFLIVRYGQNVDALNKEFARITDDIGERDSTAAQKRISRIAREQAAIASLVERME